MCIFVKYDIEVSKINQTHHYSTYGHILLEAAGCRSCDCSGFGHSSCSCGGGHQCASLTRLRGFGHARLLGLSLNLGQC